MLTKDGFILLTRTQPVRHAIERAERNGTSLGEEYFATESFAYRHKNWNDQQLERPSGIPTSWQ